MNVLCIGSSCYEISLPIKSYPKEGTKYNLDRVECGSGCSSNVAYLLGLWKVDTYYQGIIGKDTYGDKILDELKRVNVNTDLVERKGETNTSFVLVNTANGNRTLFNSKEKSDLKGKEYVVEPDIMFLDGSHFETSKKAIEKFDKSIKVIDAGRVTNELLELCNLVDYIVCSKGFAETVTKMRLNFNDKESIKKLYGELENIYQNKTIVVTLEDKGVLYKVDDKIKIMSALRLKAKDKTGCGDIFHGAFVYGLTKKLPIEKIVKISNIAAGLSITKIGSRLSIPSVEEVYEVYEKNR